MARFLVSVIALLIAPIIPTWHIWSLCRNGRPGFGSSRGSCLSSGGKV
jgi:hypothetical protein